MNIFFFLKPIADLLYQYQVLDYLLTAWCIVFLIKEKSNRLCSIDYCVIALMGIFFLSFLRNTDGWSILLKIESGFLLYFLGREYYRYWGGNHCQSSVGIPCRIFSFRYGICQWSWISIMGNSQYFYQFLLFQNRRCLCFFTVFYLFFNWIFYLPI